MESANRDFFLNNIRIVNRQLSLDNIQEDVKTFRHNVELGGFIDLEEKIINTRVSVVIHNDDKEEVLGSLNVDFSYTISDFDTVFARNKVDKAAAEDILKVVAQESMAAMRGIMFENFRGTLLHNAYLPIISTSNFGKQLLTEPIVKKAR